MSVFYSRFFLLQNGEKINQRVKLSARGSKMSEIGLKLLEIQPIWKMSENGFENVPTCKNVRKLVQKYQ